MHMYMHNAHVNYMSRPLTSLLWQEYVQYLLQLRSFSVGRHVPDHMIPVAEVKGATNGARPSRYSPNDRGEGRGGKVKVKAGLRLGLDMRLHTYVL